MRGSGRGRGVLPAVLVVAAVLPVSGASAAGWRAPVVFRPSGHPTAGTVATRPRSPTIRVRVPYAAFGPSDGLPPRLRWGQRYRTAVNVFVASNAAPTRATVHATGARVTGCTSLRLFVGGVDTLRCQVEVGRTDRRGVRRLPGLVRLDVTVHTGRYGYRTRYLHAVAPRPTCRRRSGC